MNERIKELSEQAEKYADDNFRGEPTWSEAFESKFAELIVRECVGIVADAVDHREPASTYVSKMKKHFGVKE